MPTPIEWTVAMAPSVHWKVAAAKLAVHARFILEGLPEGTTKTTNELMEALFPAERAENAEMIAARDRMYRFLLHKDTRRRPTLLPECRSIDKANTKRFYNKVTTRWLWHKAKYEPRRCPHCGGPLPEEVSNAVEHID